MLLFIYVSSFFPFSSYSWIFHYKSIFLILCNHKLLPCIYVSMATPLYYPLRSFCYPVYLRQLCFSTFQIELLFSVFLFFISGRLHLLLYTYSITLQPLFSPVSTFAWSFQRQHPFCDASESSLESKLSLFNRICLCIHNNQYMFLVYDNIQ